MNKVIDKGFRSCRFVSTIVKHPVHEIGQTVGYHTGFLEQCKHFWKVPFPVLSSFMRYHQFTFVKRLTFKNSSITAVN